jgi:spore germination protein AB
VEKIPERFLISHFLVFYLVHSMQLGIGILGFQRVVTKSAEHDAWISIIIGGIGVHLILWMIYKILATDNGDITDVHRAFFGKWIGGGLSFIIVVYFILLAITILRTYIEVVQVWVFPDLKTWVFTLCFLVLVYYIINGGFRVVTGIALLGVVLPLYLLVSFVFPSKFAFFENLFPIMDHSIKELLISAKDLTLSILGFEALLLYYPFIKDPQRSRKWAHFGVMVTILLYLLVMIISIGYFSQEQLEKNIWATITMLKIVQLPFVERIEYIAVSSWIIIILPNICITIWAASRGAKRIFNKRHRFLLICILLVIFFATSRFETRNQINMLTDITGQLGFYLIYGYIPILFVISFIYNKWKGSKTP